MARKSSRLASPKAWRGNTGDKFAAGRASLARRAARAKNREDAESLGERQQYPLDPESEEALTEIEVANTIAAPHGIAVETHRVQGMVNLAGHSGGQVRPADYFQRRDTLHVVFRSGRHVIGEYWPVAGKLFVPNRTGRMLWAETLTKAAEEVARLPIAKP